MTNKKIKIIFAGTPEIAVPFLQSLLDDDFFDIVGVITQPDKPTGRKQIISPSPIKQLALKNNLKIFQPEKLRADADIERQLKESNPDLLAVFAFGQIIPKNILATFKYGNINVHPSLLPKYRGASPIIATILNGDKETGISIMLMDDQMDHGPILAVEKIKLDDDETGLSLENKIMALGPQLLIDTIKKYLDKKIEPREQNHEQATICKTIKKDQAEINWHLSAEEISQQIHALYDWPIAWTRLDGKRIKIFPPVEIIAKEKTEPGKISVTNDKIIVDCGADRLGLTRLQSEGRMPLSAKEFSAGYDLKNKTFL